VFIIKEITNKEDFYSIKSKGIGFVVITDGAKRKIHVVQCPNVDAYYFQVKVIEHQNKNGRYYWSETSENLKEKFETVDDCLHCKHLY
jgi:hypothetical protein